MTSTNIPKTLLLAATALAVAAMFAGCRKDLEPECDGSNPTYDGEIKTIIDNTCMGSTCHKSGASRGDFTSFEGLEPYLNDGTFEREVLVDQTMPKGTKRLTQDEINKIQCWADNGFPEK